MLFWNLFNHQKTYLKPQKPFLTPNPEWNQAYQDHLTQLIQEIEVQMTTQKQIKKLLEISYYLDKALNKPHA